MVESKVKFESSLFTSAEKNQIDPGKKSAKTGLNAYENSKDLDHAV